MQIYRYFCTQDPSTYNGTNMSKTSLKKLLLQLDRDQLTEVILDLYEARKDAREYLEYFISPDENAMLEKYKAIILKEFSPSKGRPRARTSVCKKAIKEFAALHPSPRLIAELRLHFIECSTRYAHAMRSWVKDSVRKCRTTIFEDTLKYIYTNGLLDETMPRIEEILDNSRKLRGTIKDDLQYVFDDFVEQLH